MNIKKQPEKIDIEKNTKKEDLYNDFNIKLRNPIHKLKNHTNAIYCLTKLKDGRFISGSADNSGSVNCITKLNSGI